MDACVQFPRTTVENLSLSRMIIGTNWLLGWSHTGPAADKMIRERYSSAESFYPVLKAFLDYGVDTIMAPASQNEILVDAIRYTEDKTGKKMIIVDTPIVNVANNKKSRAETEKIIKKSAEIGSSLCLLHHSSVEKLVNRQRETIERISDYTYMIREAGMIPGLSAHMPEIVVYCDANNYDVQTYIQIYNCMGFMMQVEVEMVAGIIHNAKKPVMTIKPMAAGRCTPFVGLNFSWNTIRDCDMVTVGCHTADEVYEDIEISLAALERRTPKLGRRGSPNQNQSVFGASESQK